MLGFMCISQYVPKQGLFSKYESPLGNTKAGGLIFRLISIEVSDPEQQVRS
jgi:hypothetical protein